MTHVGSLRARRARALTGAIALSLAASAGASAQDHPVPATQPAPTAQPGGAVHSDSLLTEGRTGAALAQAAGEHGAAKVDIITPHITDAPHMEVPCLKPGWACEVHLPHWAWADLGRHDLGPLGVMNFDMSPTKHVVMLWIAAALSILVLGVTAAAHRRHSHSAGNPKGFASGLEAVVLYLRNNVILPNVGPHGEGFVNFCLTLFFFILFANLLGMIPYGSTATGNISVTAVLAIITFIVVEIAGMRAQGMGYLNTVIYWPHDMPLAMKLPMTFIMTPVEILGKFTKPFALAIRLFANMTAGHVVLLALISLIFTFQKWAIVPLPILMAVAISVLELFVAFLQAFIFTLLASVFIGQMRTAHH